MARTTIVNPPRQHRLDPPQIREFPPHILELLLGEHARFVAVSAVIQSQQPGHLIEAEAQSLRGFDELHPGHVRLAVAANAAVGLVRFG